MNDTNTDILKGIKSFLSIISIVSTLVLKTIITDVLKPMSDFCKKNSLWGVDAGYLAVETYRNIKDKITSLVPNGHTFELLFGTNEELEESQKLGFYEWKTFGTSKLIGSSEELAKIATKNELIEISKHNDIDSYTKNILRDAIQKKDQKEFSDMETLRIRHQDSKLNSIINTLKNNKSDLGKMWYDFSLKSQQIVKVNPSRCIVECHTLNGKEESLSINSTFSNDILENVEKSIQFIKIIKKHMENINFNLRYETERDEIYFTVYGTIVKSYRLFDIIKYEKLIKNGMKKPYRHGKMARINVVVGYIDAETLKIKEKQIAPNDIVFNSFFTENIITKTSLEEPSSLPSPSSSFNSSSPSSPSSPSNTLNTDISIRQNSSAIPTLPQLSTENVSKVTVNDVTQTVWNKLTELGFTKEQTAGIMGNMMRESSMNPTAHNKSGGGQGAFGLCQWRGARLTALKKFASQHGKEYTDPSIQCEFIMHELQTTHKNVLKALKQTTTVDEASWVWVKKFEIPSTDDAVLQQENQKRLGFANGFYLKYGGSVLNTSNSINVSPSLNTIPQFSSPSSGSSGSSVSSGFSSSSGISSGFSSSNSVSGSNGVSGSSDGKTISASQYARAHAHSKSQGRCARYVANALQAVGFKFQRQGSAYMYHTNGILSKMGFNIVSNDYRGFRPQIGDICVINRFGTHKHGHICIWDGRNWISDFIQRNASPYKDGAPNGSWIYRYGSNQNTVDVDQQTVEVPELSYQNNASNVGSSVEEYENQNSSQQILINNNTATSSKSELEFGMSESFFDIPYTTVI